MAGKRGEDAVRGIIRKVTQHLAVVLQVDPEREAYFSLVLNN